jgi:mono/diheme cytochrome c family protein
MNATRRQSMHAREDYTGLVTLGLGLALFLLIGLGIYWFGDSSRLESAAAILRQGRIQRGSEIFTGQCAGCHGMQGEGGVGPALQDRAVLKNTPDEIFFSVIRSGVPNTQMPSWSVDFGGPLTDEDIHDVVAFIRDWETTAPEVAPKTAQPNPAQGALLFSSTCALCHGENGLGGKEGVPALNDPERLAQFDDDWYRGVIANGRPAKGMPTWGTVLAPVQIDDLVALLAAWREGQDVQPAFSLADLLDQARFALLQDDPASARLQLDRAIQISTGDTAAALRRAVEQIEAGNLGAAAETLAGITE